VFLVGLGGGTGSGAIPVLARLAREMGVLTMVIATQPFMFEGDERRRNADIAMADLKGVADAIITFPNERLFEVVQAGGSLGKAFQLADRYLVEGILAIWQMMNQRGLIHLDFADVQRLVRHSGGLCTLATVELSAVDGAKRAAEALLASPLLDRGQVVNRAHGAILGITAGPELPLEDVQAIVRDIRGAVARPDLRLSMGVVVEPAMSGKLRLLLLITEEWRDTPGAGAAAAAGELDLSADTLDAAKPKVVQTDLGLDTDTSTTGRFKDVADDQAGEDDRDDRDQLDQDVQRRAGGVLERVAHGVADDGRLVVGRALAVDDRIGMAGGDFLARAVGDGLADLLGEFARAPPGRS
jgi:cell division GTPase FtsZ